ncbi:MAG: cell division protein SepF [Actinomycetota bacterium]
MAGIFQRSMEFLGFAEESNELPTRAEPVTTAQRPTRVIAPRPRRGASDVAEIFTIEPKSYEDAAEVAAHYRVGIPVIVNMGEMSEVDSRRMLDFMLGLKEGLEGHMRRVTPKVFLLTPTHVAVNQEQSATPESEVDELLVRP